MNTDTSSLLLVSKLCKCMSQIAFETFDECWRALVRVCVCVNCILHTFTVSTCQAERTQEIEGQTGALSRNEGDAETNQIDACIDV